MTSHNNSALSTATFVTPYAPDEAALPPNHVMVSRVGNQLVISGDDLANNIRLDQPAPGQVRVLPGAAGTMINGQAGPLTFTDVISVLVRLGGGDDTLTIAGAGQPFHLAGKLTIVGGTGNDTVNLINVAVDRNLAITDVGALRAVATLQDDTVGGNLTLQGPVQGTATPTLDHVQVNGLTQITTGAGDDAVTVNDSIFAGAFLLFTGAGDDHVTIQDQAGATTFGGPVQVNLGTGQNLLTLAPDVDDVVHLNGAWSVFDGGPDGSSRTASNGLLVGGAQPVFRNFTEVNQLD